MPWRSGGGPTRRGGGPREDADEDEEELLEWDMPNTRDSVLWLIDAGQKMHDTLLPLGTGQDGDNKQDGTKQVSLFHKAMKAAFNFQRSKLVNSPSDHCGILLFNTQESKVSDAGKNVAYPHGITIQSIAQVSVPPISEIKDDLQDSLDNGPGYFRRKYIPADKQCRIHHALGNAEAMLFNLGKAGTKRVFFVTNEDNPMGDKKGKSEQHRLALEKVKSMTRRGIEFEPFLISTDDHPFETGHFYADLFSAYSDDEGDIVDPLDDAEAANYLRRPWNATVKFDHLEADVGARETPKRVVFSLPMFLGPDVTMGVNGYATIVRAGKGNPVKVHAMPREDEDDPIIYKEIVTETKLVCEDTGRELDNERDVDIAFSFGTEPSLRAKVRFSPGELRKLRMFGQLPSIRILGFKPREELHFFENVKHSYFIYPSDVQWQNSQRAFGALMESMAKTERIAIALFTPRMNLIPTFAALLPQREERGPDGQIEPPGMYVVPLPYADDIREAPEKHRGDNHLRANEAQIEAAGKIVRAFTRNAAFNPDFFPNPSLDHHYKVLLAVAFGDEVPEEVEDKTMPAYELIDKRTRPLVELWKHVIEQDSRIGQLNQEMKSGNKKRAASYSLEDEQEFKRLRQENRLDSLTIPELKAALDFYRLPTAGRKMDLVERIHHHMSSLLKVKKEEAYDIGS